jgi:hypothetical protein
MPHLLSGGIAAPSPDTILAVGVLAAGLLACRFGLRWLGWWERPLALLARRRRLAILVAAAAPLVLRALLLPVFAPPEPGTHDEFSFLLAADTFAHGRLVNPQHPFWVHFESVHTLARPVYASAFPIAPAAALAVGQVLLGHPWAGVWLSAGFMCGAICWMLQGWLPPRWALLGALLVVLRIGVSSYWMNSYWGGCVAAAGGALVLGALPRMMRAPHWHLALAMGTGLAILANSRPVEGGCFGLGVAVVLFWWMLGKRGPGRSVAWRQIVLPLAVFLGLAAIGVGYYFARVTGKPWMAPYVLYRNSMTMAPHFIWQTPTAEPLYNNWVMRHFYVSWEMANYEEARRSLAADLTRKMGVYWRFYVGPLLTIPLFALPFLRRDRKLRQLAPMAAIFALSLVGQVWHNAHYAAPALGLAILIVVLGMRSLRLWRWRGRRVGLYVVRCLPPACAAMLLISIVTGRFSGDAFEQRSWRWPPPGNVRRARILRRLQTSGGKHLVFVRYDLSHDLGYEWVYNPADIDGSPVVFARELDRGSNVELMRYFSDRRVWMVEPDVPSPKLVPYGDAPPRPMLFVQLGAPGIAVLRDPVQLRQKVLEQPGAGVDALLTCDAWDFVFMQATGVSGPDVTAGCYGSARGQPVRFERWFSWLARQR